MDDDKQCRICLDGPEAEGELGRLIKPCLCRGTVSLVHVRCLQTWRNAAASRSQFFTCPNCRYHYRFARTRIAGLATNPAVVAALSSALFTALVLLASFVTTAFLAAFDDPAPGTFSPHYSLHYLTPLDLAHELVRAALRILRDEPAAARILAAPVPRAPPGALRALVRRFVLGLPVVGAGSLVHMLLSAPLLGPLHWLARYRGSRRRENSRDAAALVIVALLAVGAARALYKVYQWTQAATKRILLRAEDAILEVP